MKKLLLGVFFLIYCNLSGAQDLTVYMSRASVEETTRYLTQLILDSDTLVYFETVAHDAVVKKHGFTVPPARSVLFEDPLLTATLIQCNSTVAIGLPLEILVWEENGDVYIGFEDPKLMKRRFMIEDCRDTLPKLTSLMVRLVNDTLRGVIK